MWAIAGQVVAVLAGFVADQGATLAKEGGKAAVDAAGRLLDAVMKRLKGDPAEAKNAERFETNPKGYSEPLKDALRDQLEGDPEFAKELESLLEAVREQAPGTVSILVTGSGAAAAQGAAAAGQGGAAAVGGNAIVHNEPVKVG